MLKHLLSLLSVSLVALWLSGCDSKPAAKPAAAPAPAGGAAVEDDHAGHDHAEGEEDHDDEPSTESSGGSY